MDVANAGMHLLGARRAPMNQDEFDTKFNYLKSARQYRYSLEDAGSEACLCGRMNVRSPRRDYVSAEGAPPAARSLTATLESYLPVVHWLPRYDLQKDFTGDLYSGMCLGLLGLCQGLAFAFLAGLPPVCGLYTTCISSLVYIVVGTSPFSFLSTNAIICFFVRNVLVRYSTPHDNIYLYGSAHERTKDLVEGSEQMKYAAALTFLTAVFQALIYMLRLDFVFPYVSKHVVGGVCFGSAVQVILSQLQHVLHVKGNQCVSELSAALSIYTSNLAPPTFKQCHFVAAYQLLHSRNATAVFPLFFGENSPNPPANHTETCILSVWDCFRFINIHTFALSFCAFTAMIFARQIIGPFLREHVNVPVPFEFILLMSSGFVAYGFDVQDSYGVEIVKHFGHGWHLVGIPSAVHFQNVFYDALALALLVYVMHFYSANEMSRICKSKMDSRQELIATVVSSGVCGLFGAHPPGQSMNRNRMGVDTGASTVVTNVFIAFVTFPMVFWSKVMFSFIPVCVFSSIIIHSMGEYLKEPRQLSLLWAVSKLDTCTFVFSAIFSIFSTSSTASLFYSTGFALFTVIWRAQWPKFQHLVNVTGSGAYYAERNCYGSDLLEESGVAIVRFEAALLFHNTLQFKRDISHACANIKGQLLGPGIGTRAGSMKSNNALSVKDVPMRSTLLISGDIVPNLDMPNPAQSMHKVCIIDFGAVPTVDTAGLEAMRDVFERMAEHKVRILFAAVNATIRHRFKVCEGFEVVPKHHFFPSVHDAVLCAQQMGGACAPSVHMSVSMNGYRDLIALSSATSHHDHLNRSNTQVDVNVAETLSVRSRNSISDNRNTPPLSLK